MSDWDDGRPESEQRTSLGRLVERLTEQVSRIVRAEIALLKAQATETAKAAGVAIAAFTVAGVLAFFGLAYLVYAGYLGLAHAFDDWLAALLTFVGLLVIAGVLGAVGAVSLKRGKPDTTATIDRVKQDVAALTGGSSK